MNNFMRAIPFVWPYRRKIFISMFFAGLVALFWGLNVSMTFLVVEVFVKDKNAHELVSEKIADAQETLKESNGVIKAVDEQLQAYENRELTEDEAEDRLHLLNKRSRRQAEVTQASGTIDLMSWVQLHAVPLLPEKPFNLLALIWGVLILATVLKGVCIVCQEILIGSVVELGSMGIRKRCYRKVLALDSQSLAQFGTSDLMSRFTHDMTQMAGGLRLIGGKVIREPLKALSCICIAFFISWQLTLLSFLFAPLAAFALIRIGKKLKQASRRMMESMSRIYKTLEESFDSMKIIIAFNGARQHRRKFHDDNKAYYTKAMRIVRIDALTSPTTEVFGLAAACVAMLPGAYLVLRQTTEIWGIQLVSTPIEVATLSTFYVTLASIIDPARKLSTTYSKLKRATAAADRVFALVDKEPLVKSPERPKAMPHHQKSITFDSVSFAYATHDDDQEQRPLALNEVSLTVNAGEVIAVVGTNGSGKSTLVNLLPRFYDADHGHVLIDDVDICDVRPRDLREQISVVTQETFLFDTTVLENIRYGKPTASNAEIIEAAIKAHVDQFIEQFPEGYETNVGEKGQKLSGGQRQRIALARAILRNPTIMILDEATSAIDSQSEKLIHETLTTFLKGRTGFIITHSVSQSILDFVTRIAVMDHGHLIACGTHQQLIATCPIYLQLYRAQVEQRTVDEQKTVPASGSTIETTTQQPTAEPQSASPILRVAHFPEGEIAENELQEDSNDSTDKKQPDSKHRAS